MKKIKVTKKYGRGLYATKNIKKGEIVEISPVVLVDKYEADKITDIILNVYVFEWSKGASALALGNGSLFNHSRRYNVSYMNSHRSREIVFIAQKNIKKGRQLFIDYGYDPAHGLEVTRKNREITARKAKSGLDNRYDGVDRPLMSPFLREESATIAAGIQPYFPNKDEGKSI